MSKHNLSRADTLYWGDAYFAQLFATNERVGAPITPLTKLSLGSPATLDTDGLVTAATSTELPDTETVTYTTADDGTTPFDNAATPVVSSITTSTGATASVWALDVPRNVTSVTSHGSSVVAMTIIVTGYDVYKVAMSETITVAATGTSQVDATTKAFAYIESYAITAAADAEANTLNMGWGDVLGLPYALNDASDLIQQPIFNDVIETTAATIATADGTTATATTDDVRGTLALNSASDGSTIFVYMAIDPSTKTKLVGVDQYGG